jgi:hypothetical protein
MGLTNRERGKIRHIQPVEIKAAVYTGCYLSINIKAKRGNQHGT